LPGSSLHNQPINDGEIKNIRVSLFTKIPPVTRVVIDLKECVSLLDRHLGQDRDRHVENAPKASGNEPQGGRRVYHGIELFQARKF
jgi:AMIN domain